MQANTDDSGLSGTGSASRLVLLPNTDDPDPTEEYVSDEELEDESEDSPLQPGVNSLSIPPLPPSVLFLYLLSPYLRLGAIFASDFHDASFANGLIGLVIAAFLSAVCRQIWFLLGRYLRATSTEDILVHAFARRHRRVGKNELARHTFTVIRGLFKLLLAAMYLRDSIDVILLFKVPESVPLHSRLNVSILLSILVFVLSLPRSLAAESIVCSTALSVASFIAWLVALSRPYGTNQLLPSNPSLFRRGLLWNEISFVSYVDFRVLHLTGCLLLGSLTFACASTMTVPLSASLVAGNQSVTSASRNARIRSFELLNIFSAMLAAFLMLPLVVVAASPRVPASIASSENLTHGFRIATLVLSMPSVIVSVTSIPPSYGAAYRFIRTDLALSVIILAILALSLVPPTIANILDDATLILAVFGTFVLPALAHITVHYFRRPLSIVVPHRPSLAPGEPSPSTERPPSPSRDSLLQRKERLLQRSRFGKRLLWDIVIWIVLLPVCACAFIWAVGRLARRW